MSIYSHLWLGESHDPKPVFRDEAPEGARAEDGTLHPWPDGAVMAVEFTADRFPTYAIVSPHKLGVRFFADDGWPLDFPACRKETAPGCIREEFQVCPTTWQSIHMSWWEDLNQDPFYLKRKRIMSGLVRPILNARR